MHEVASIDILFYQTH